EGRPVDGNQSGLRAGHAFKRELRPRARRCAKVEHELRVFEDMLPLVNFLELVDRARQIVLALSLTREAVFVPASPCAARLHRFMHSSCWLVTGLALVLMARP